LDLGKGLSK